MRDDPLVLDTFDPVVSAAPEIWDLLRGFHTVSTLVTCRERLRLTDAIVQTVGPLSVPSQDELLSLDDIAVYDSVALFVARAQRIAPAWRPDGGNIDDVVRICRRLEGLPLAIELAAARTNMFSPGQILDLLRDRFAFLSRGDRDMPVRHQALRAAFDWSYELLSPAEQSLLSMLSVFEGGFTVDSAEAICRPFMKGTASIPDLLPDLLDKSWLFTSHGTTGEVRLQMLDTIREYAAEKLSGVSHAPDIQDAHLQYFLDVAASTHAHAEEMHRGEPGSVGWKTTMQTFAPPSVGPRRRDKRLLAHYEPHRHCMNSGLVVGA
jgi:predicted ATPase